MKDRPQWVVWGPRKNSKGVMVDKTPVNLKTGCNADPTDPNTWGIYTEAAEAMTKINNIFGIGFVFAATDAYCGIDLDKCRNPQTGEIEPWALDIVKQFNSYTEISPSGSGLHIIIKGKKPGPKCKKRGGRIEMYDCAHYFTITGNLLPEEST